MQFVVCDGTAMDCLLQVAAGMETGTLLTKAPANQVDDKVCLGPPDVVFPHFLGQTLHP